MSGDVCCSIARPVKSIASLVTIVYPPLDRFQFPLELSHLHVRSRTKEARQYLPIHHRNVALHVTLNEGFHRVKEL